MIAKDALDIDDFTEYGTFYYSTYPDRPEWRFANANEGIAIDANTGEVLKIEKAEPNGNYTISRFLAELIPPNNIE